MRIEKIVIPIIFLLAAAGSLEAQAYDLGLLIGGNWASSNISVAPGTPSSSALDATAGIGIGAYSHWTLLPSLLSMDVDLLYVNNTQSGGTTSVGFHSIDIPLIFRYPGLPYFKPGLGFKYSAFVGSYNTTTAAQSTSTSFGNAVSSTQGIGSSNISFVVSMGGRYGLSHGYVLVGQLDFDFGFSDLNNPSIANASNKLNNVMLLVGVSREF